MLIAKVHTMQALKLYSHPHLSHFSYRISRLKGNAATTFHIPQAI